MKFADIRVWLASHVVKSAAQRNFLKHKVMNLASKLTLAISHFASGLHQTSSAARIWNSLPEYIPSLEKRACFKKEVNRYLGDN